MVSGSFSAKVMSERDGNNGEIAIIITSNPKILGGIIMTSSDIVITTSRSLPEILSGIEQQVRELKQDTKQQISGLRQDISALQSQTLEMSNAIYRIEVRQEALADKMDFTLWFMGICFAAMTILVVIAPGIRRFWHEVFAPIPKPEDIEQRIMSKVDALIDEKLSRLS